MLRVAWRVACLALGAAVLYVLVTAVEVWWTSRRHAAGSAEAAVVLGSAQYDGVPSPDLAARCAQALALYRQGRVAHLVLTGGKQPGDQYTEAQSEARWLEAHGVPQSAVLAEVGGRDSYASLRAAARHLEAAGMRRVMLVSDPFHEARILAMSSSLGLRALPSPTRTSPIRGSATVPYFAKETVALAAGRLIGWSRLEQLGHSLGIG